MRSREILPVIERYPSVRVLCVGDVMLDRFVYGEVTRISPEAPIPVISVREERRMLGGAGNVARNVAALGAMLDFIAVVGRDSAGEEIRGELRALENCAPRLVEDASRKTSAKIRYLSRQQQMLRVDSETTAPICEARFGEILVHFRNALPGCDVVLLSDYAKGVLSGDYARRLIDECRGAAKPVFVDPKGHDFTRYRGATLIKPNLAELREASRMPAQSAEEVETAARDLVDRAEAGAMLVTRGAEGMMLVRPGLPTFEVHGRAREIFDVSGAGDTAAANLAVAFAAGAKLEHAVSLANAAAGLVVSKLGTATVTREQLLWELEAEEALSAERRIQDGDLALEQAMRWRSAGLRVRALAGRFDMPRAELFELLRNARSECDRLLIAVITEGADPVTAGASAELCQLLSALIWVDLLTAGPEDRVTPIVALVNGPQQPAD